MQLTFVEIDTALKAIDEMYRRAESEKESGYDGVMDRVKALFAEADKHVYTQAEAMQVQRVDVIDLIEMRTHDRKRYNMAIQSLVEFGLAA